MLVIILTAIPFSARSQENKRSEEEAPDFKLIEANDSYVEIEYRPQFTDQISFKNKISETSKRGAPDVGLRSFPLILPGKAGNRLEIIDSRFEEFPNGDIKPVPRYAKDQAGKYDSPVYEGDPQIYNSTEFYPRSAGEINFAGSVRNKYVGYANVYPVQFNPVTGIVRKYSYIKFRVVFGSSPLYGRKPLSPEERSFSAGFGINGSSAARWSTQEFENVRDLPLANSIFANGNFHKIEIKETGIFRLDRNYLRNAGVDVDNLDPRTIKIYGNDGSELAYDNQVATPVDPVENRIFVAGESDGIFNDGDYVLFYGKGTNSWTYDTLARTWLKQINHFSVSNYYWLTYGGANGLRMQTVNSNNTSGLQPLPYFTEKFFEEPEVNNLGSTGYLWVSQSISVNQSFSFNRELKGYIDGSDVNVRFRFGNGSFFPEIWRLEDLSSGFQVNQYVQPLSSIFTHIIISYLNDNRYGVSYTLNPGKRNIDFRASLPSSAGNSSNVIGYYDFLEVLYKREFKADNNLLSFTSPDTSGTLLYVISGFTSNDVNVFDVTNHSSPSITNPVQLGNGTVRFEAQNSMSSPKQYVASAGNFRTPSAISGRIDNQNLKGDLASGASFIIVTPKEFLSAANRLKAQREKPGPDYLKTAVVEVSKIYNEFASGLEDPVAIRNFLKYAYNNWTERPVYVLFFGDGSYDYKNIYSLYNNNIKNWVPPIQKNSDFSDDVDSYCSDDYMVEFTESYPAPAGTNIVDMASGRFCVNSLEEANNVVDKVIAYEDPVNFDKWRTEVMYVADDGWTTENTGGQEGSLHTDQCEDVAQNHSPGYIYKDKVYIVTYPSEITPQGRRKPGVNSDIVKKWNEGRLVINYTGHGSTDLWAHEHVFVRQTSIPQLNNKNRYPFVTIASCDLARWDDPFNISAAEQLVFIKDKGAVGISAAVRPVYSIPNAIYNNKLYDNLFKADTLEKRLRLGKAIYNVKQELYYDNDMKFALIGDPSLRLGLPQYRTRIDSINSVPGNSLFEMKALQKVRIFGSVLKSDSTFWNNFNGELDIRVLDVDKNIVMLDFGYQFSFKQPGGAIYSGKATVANGLWNVEFVVPRDISYNTGRGKMLIYFGDNTVDGLGYSDNFIMNGIDTTAAPDSTGPSISVFLDNRNFRSGDLVNQSPKLIVDFFDENGLNLTGSIGHKIEAVLNENSNQKIDLTGLYTSTSGYQNGSLEYAFDNLPDGNHKLEITAWDTYNNYSSAIVDFQVKSTGDLALDEVYNFPNPMKDATSFMFQHNFDESIEARILIYTTAGRLIKELNKSNITDKFVSIDWDGRDNDGDYIANGTYIYKVNIKTESGSFAQNSTGKLVVLK
ncbi:MAG: type IX secretion system sortase PorU [Ignavibacteria bacterium]|nr:type IX secretion system sortase PorU [Ignavibacteria bacterium]